MDNQEMKEIFDHFDGDGNGLIDRKEFSKLLDALGADMSPDELAIGFELIDVDHNGLIDFREFATWWHERP
jgi:Ca2+-binding EF-hand superfamily protein